MTKHLTLIALSLSTAIACAAPAADALRQGQTLFRAGDLDGAAEALEQAVELAPNDAEAHHLLGATYGRQAQAASMFGKMRLAGKIKDEFERAVALAPETLDYRESLLQFYAAAPAVAGGGVDKARAQAAEIAKRDAVRGDLAFAMVARVEGKPDEAMARLQAAYAKRPDDARLGVQIGLLLQEQKRYDEAFAHFQRMVARDPEALGAWYQLGRTAVLAKTRLADGEAALRKYLAGTPGPQDPPLAAAHWRLGMVYELMKKVAEARAEYEAALKLDPAHAESKAALKNLK
jgi:tetratricopeptide (TPR) repeat protein